MAVIASGAKQSAFAASRGVDCVVAALLAMTAKGGKTLASGEKAPCAIF